MGGFGSGPIGFWFLCCRVVVLLQQMVVLSLAVRIRQTSPGLGGLRSGGLTLRVCEGGGEGGVTADPPFYGETPERSDL